MNGKDGGRFAWMEALRRLLSLLLVLLVAGGVLILFRSLVNKVTLISYDSGNYSPFPEILLHRLQLGENYVVPYNMGNLAYQREEYGLAVQYYSEALQNDPPAEEKECAVRINLALALLRDYPFEQLDEKDSEQVEEALEVLYLARGVLTEHGCACKEVGVADGHSEEAENLKRDIDEMIERLTPPQSGEVSGGETSPDDDGDGDGDPQQGQGGPDAPDDGSQGEGDPDDSDGGGDAPPEPPRQSPSDGPTQEEKQQELQSQLEEQKQDLESGNYSGGMRDFNYIDIGETVGFGEGAPW